MADSYSVKAILSASDKGFSATINKALSSVKSAMSSITFGALTSMGATAFSKLSSGVTGLVSEINDSNAAWKTFEGNMNILGKGADEIDKAKKELQEFAQQTVYSSSDMASTYAQLAAVGVKDTAKLVKGFGGLAAAAEDPQQAMKTLSQQATQMAAKPTVAWADFKLMLEQSPAGMAAVAKHMGMTTAELVTSIQAGTVKTEEFFDAINKVGTSKGFADLATEAKTMGQAMDGLKETLGNKLTPAFDVLSKIGIKAIDKISGALSKINAQGLADKVSGWVKKAQPMWNSFKKAVSTVWQVISGVGKKLAPIFQSMSKSARGSFKGMLDAIGKIDVSKAINKISAAIMKLKPYFDALKNVVNAVKKAILALLPVVKKIIDFFLDNSEAIAKLIPWIIGLVGAFKAFKVIKTIAPAVSSFAKSIASMAAKGIKGIASKLFGISRAQKEVGKSSKTSSKQMLASAKAFMMIGVGVLMIAGGFALLALSAIKIAEAGWPAIAVMAGLVIAVAALSLGMMKLLNGITATPKKMTSAAIAMLAMGAAVLLISVGFALLAQSAIALAAAGWPAIAVMVGLIAAIALLAIGAAALGTALTAGAIGFIAFGAAILLCGAGALLAAVAIQLIAGVLPVLCQYGLQGAVVILALGAAMIVFAAGAALAGVASVVLGAGMLVLGAALLVVGAGMLLVGTGALMAAAALMILTTALPILVTYGAQGVATIMAFGGALLLFGAGALVAGAAALVATVGIIAFGAGMIVAAAGTILMAAALLLVTAEMKSIAKNAKSAEKSLKSMRKSVDVVESGLKAIKNIAKSAMSKLLDAFDNTASKVKSAGKKVGKGFSDGMKGGLATAPMLAMMATMQIAAALNAGAAAAKAAGVNIGKGLANGMRSQLGNIKSVAAQMAAAADKAVRAKAKIKSPSRVSEGLGSYWGEGFVNGIAGMAKEAWKAATMLVSVPNVATPDLAMAYAGELSEDYNYNRISEYIIEVPVVIEGKEVAKVTAPYTEAVLNKRQTRDSRKRGRA